MMMPSNLRDAFDKEMELANSHFSNQDYDRCFSHLERAHILGQRFYIPHVKNHFWMLRVGLKQRNLREIVGQCVRILGSAGSLIGIVPIGNTGGSNVSAIKPMPIPDDLARYFDE